MNELEHLLDYSPMAMAVVALNVLGLVLKKLAWYPDKLIPVMLPVVGSVLFVALDGLLMLGDATMLPVLRGVCGFIAGGVAVWGHQVFTQLWKTNETTTTTPTGS